MTALKVFLHNPNGKILLGRLAYQNRQGHLELNSHFLSQNINLSPLHLKHTNNLQTAQRSPFNGLHGVFADSLPDGWGLLLMDRRLRQQGIALHTITPLDR
ncbi:MAG: HipA N-terminal domain-containing protein, partial [Psychrosphaera sp.]|nr:HipA N-terminal domain-containing protein [Psychrosphaera sp.]